MLLTTGKINKLTNDMNKVHSIGFNNDNHHNPPFKATTTNIKVNNPNQIKISNQKSLNIHTYLYFSCFFIVTLNGLLLKKVKRLDKILDGKKQTLIHADDKSIFIDEIKDSLIILGLVQTVVKVSIININDIA